MIPTTSLILTIALSWTLPASAAVFFYRVHDSSIANLKRSLRRRLGRP